MRDWYFMELGAKAPFLLDVSAPTLKRGMIKEVSLLTCQELDLSYFGDYPSYSPD